MTDAEVKVLLEKNGATIEKGYNLVNNYGWIFWLDGHRYDVRFWANCYGASPNIWEIMSADGTGNRMDPDLKNRLEKEMNS